MKTCVVALVTLTVALTIFAGAGQENLSGQVAPEPVVFRILNGAEPPTLDPSLSTDTTSHNILLAMFEGLLTYDPYTNEGIPGVAESWSVSGDGTVYTFKLRKTTWSDGVPITAQSFVDSWLRTLSPDTASPYAWLMSMVVEGASAYNTGEAGPEAVKIRAVDDRTFEVTMVGPVPYVASMLPHTTFAVLPLHVIEKHGEAWTLPGNMVSNGAYVLEQWKPQEVLTVVRNPAYWDADKVRVDKIVYIPSEEDTVRLNMYLAEEADWLNGGIPPDQLQAMKLREDFQAIPALATMYYQFNHTMPLFADVKVRKALAMAFDKQLFFEHVAQGVHTPTDTMVPAMKGYPKLKGNHYDVEAARMLFAEAGYPKGRDFPEITILYPTGSGAKKLSEYIQQQWSENLNISVQIENVEWITALERGRTQDFDLLFMGWLGDYIDPNTFLELFQTGFGSNFGKYANSEFDMLLQDAARMPAGAERTVKLQRAEDILAKQDQAVIPVFHYTLQYDRYRQMGRLGQHDHGLASSKIHLQEVE
jgi:oligopeptide transport system substrate-binding protein